MKLSELALSSLPHTSPRTVKQLQNLSIFTYQDLLDHFPFRYVDYSKKIDISDIINLPVIQEMEQKAEELHLVTQGRVTIQGFVEHFTSMTTRRGFSLQKARIHDDSGNLEVTWFNQPYLRSVLKTGEHISLSGYLKQTPVGKSFFPEEFELIPEGEKGLHTGRIMPIYSQTRGLSSKTIREKVRYILKTFADELTNTLPEEILKKYDLSDDIFTYKNIHFPQDIDSMLAARKRKAFEEFFVVQLSSQLIKKEWERDHVSNIIDVTKYKKELDSLIETLPFKLTKAQDKVLDEILHDMSKKTPMNRLVQGDVGSGKTVVAALAGYVSYLNGLQTIIMAPTEILAQQHFQSIESLFNHLPIDSRPTIELVTRNTKPTADDISNASILIGTHALISDKIKLGKVGLVVVDEQHKFGVAQRAKLKEKGLHPHLLSMTATPIPRTVMLTMYGELDISIIDELPVGRKTIKTFAVPPEKRQDAYAWINKEIATLNTQAFIVCPLIDESNSESMQNIKAVTQEYEHLSKEIFPGLKLGLLHGKLKKDEKTDVMEKFSLGEYKILVSTPVIEVGIDIPQATIMLIEASERFGLAQLHQLRGRVGRSDLQSYCLLFTESSSPKSLNRLKFFSQTNSGFKLAEYDLQQRGGGNVYGTQQHGSDYFKIATFADADLIEETREAATLCIKSETLTKYPLIESKLQKYRINLIAPN